MIRSIPDFKDLAPAACTNAVLAKKTLNAAVTGQLEPRHISIHQLYLLA